MRKEGFALVALASLALWAAAPAQAVGPVINHGTFVATNVTFEDVSEQTQSAGDPDQLWVAPFGSPLVFGNQLFFFPPSFTATSTGGVPDVTASLLTTRIVGNAANNTIDKIELRENGDAILAGTGTAATLAATSVSGTVTVLEDVVGPLAVPEVIPFSGTFVPSASYDLVNNPGTSLWTGSLVVDVSSVVPGATVADLALDNVLTADSEVGSSASISKKVVSGPVITIGVVQDCGLEIDKTCCIPQPPSPGFLDNLCDGKPIRAVFEYTGEDCSATTNDQEGSATCSGVSGSGPASLVFTKDASKHVATPSSGFEVGDLIEFTNPVDGELRSNLRFDVSGSLGTQSLKIHTSCSKALRCGDRFGGMELVELETTLGGTTVCSAAQTGEQTGTTCSVTGGSSGTPCDEKLVEAVFEYTGNDCANPLANPQGGQAKCAGDPSDASGLVSITYTGKNPNEITVAPASNVDVGDQFRITATGRKDFHPNLEFLIADSDSIEQSVEFHVSCSQPLACGDEFGAVRLVSFTTKSGLEVDCSEEVPTSPFLDACTVPLTPPTPHCTNKVMELQLAYVDDVFGLGCSVTNAQGGQASCTGVAGPGSPVSVIIVTDPSKITANPSVGINAPGNGTVDIISITKFDGEVQQELPSTLQFTVTGPNGSQDLEIHTSCSKSLDLGDLFGSFAVIGMERLDDGFVGLGGQVEYQYTVTNLGPDSVGNVSVQDDLLGLIASGETLASGETKQFFTTATLFESLTNTGAVSGDVGGQQCLPASDQVDTTVTLPPQGAWDCKEAKPIDELAMEWAGVQDICVRAWDGAVGGPLLKQKDGISPMDVLEVAGMGGSPNDQVWEIFPAGACGNALAKLGESKFHISCSDSSMNGIEDCGRNQGDGKDNDLSLVNDWLLEGMAGDTSLDCTPDEVTQTGGGFCGLGAELAFLLPPIMWLRARRRRQRA